MKTYISPGDFIDSYYRLKNHGVSFFLKRAGISNSKRIKGAWNSVTARSDLHWWDIPAVRERWNKLATGNPRLEPNEYFFERYFPDGGNLNLLSPGCGTGDKEIALAGFWQVGSIDAFDIAEKRIEVAVRKAAEKNIKKIRFFVADISRYDFGKEKYDIIIFDSFLHHVKEVEEMLSKCRAALKKDGFLIINEYVGPNRFQWSAAQLNAANKLLSALPAHLKRRASGKVKGKIYRPGILRMILSDPSEAVNSEAILPGLEKYFSPVEVHPYGGNILQLLLKDIERNFVDLTDEEKTELDKIFDAEDEFINKGKSDFLFGIYKPKQS